MLLAYLEEKWDHFWDFLWSILMGREDLLEKGWLPTPAFLGFPGCSAGEASTRSAGDPISCPGLWTSADKGIGYPLQRSWASLVAQLGKSPPAMWETWVGSLGWEDPLDKGKATHPSILAWRIPWTVLSMGLQRIGQDWVIFTFHFF